MIVEKLDQIVKDSGVINLQRRVISIKIKGYRKNQDNAGYLQAAGLYYELSEIMERENKDMIVNMLYVRSSLECEAAETVGDRSDDRTGKPLPPECLFGKSIRLLL